MKRSRLLLLAVGAWATALLAGCGGSVAPPPADGDVRGASVLTQSPTMEQLRADLERAGKQLPEFLLEGATISPTQVQDADAPIGPANYMSVLNLNVWRNNEYCSSRRTKWYECNLTRNWSLVDVSLRDRGGDPDLYVFSPIRPGDGMHSVLLIGYSLGTRDEQVGSFYPGEWGGVGRFIAAVYAWGSSAASYNIRFW